MKNNDESWSLCLSAGAFISIDEREKIPQFVKDIGLGASLHILTLKALMKMFLILTIINTPAMFFYS